MTILASYLYRDGSRAEEVPLTSTVFEAKDGEFVWIGLVDPTAEEMSDL